MARPIGTGGGEGVPLGGGPAGVPRPNVDEPAEVDELEKLSIDSHAKIGETLDMANDVVKRAEEELVNRAAEVEEEELKERQAAQVSQGDERPVPPDVDKPDEPPKEAPQREVHEASEAHDAHEVHEVHEHETEVHEHEATDREPVVREGNAGRRGG